MGQARRQKIRESDTQIEFKPRLGNGSAEGESVPVECVTFFLEDCTQLAEGVEPGTSVYGDFQEPRVSILIDAGIIGYAPLDLSKQIRQRAQMQSASISGIVTFMRPPRAVEVEICI